MLVNRKAFLETLHAVDPGVSAKAAIEQSDCLVFSGDRVIAFNDEILASAPSPFSNGLNAVVKADDVVKMLAKLPDDEIDVTKHGEELLLKGARRKAGITCVAEATSPYESVPTPGKWRPIEDGIADVLRQASSVCGRDDTQYLTTVVHVTPERVEACDNERLLRHSGKTGFRSTVLIPGQSVGLVCRRDIKKVSIGEGWVHFKTANNVLYSVRCSEMKYHDGLDALLVMEDAEDLRLPSVLVDMVRRADVMNDTVFGSRITLCIRDHELVISARKEGGWYKERKKISYAGRSLEFEVNPELICELLERSNRIQINATKMKVTSPGIEFVVALMKVESDEDK
jgi:hypothetical protein